MKKQNSFSGKAPWLGGLGLALAIAGTAWVVEARRPPLASKGPLSVEGLPLGKQYPYRSPLALTASSNPEDKTLYVIHHTGRSVETVDLDTGKILRSISLAAAPSGLALDAERNRLYVTLGLDDGRVAVIDTKKGKRVSDFSVGHTPVSPVLSPDGKTLYVCNRFQNEVAAYDVETGKVRAQRAVAREPMGAARTPDGAWLVVVHHLPAQAANAPHVAIGVDLIDTATMTLGGSVLLPNGSTDGREVCVSPDGQYAYVTHTLGRFHLPTTQLERGWMNTSALSILDLKTKTLLTTVLLDDVDRGAANPWGVACSADGKWLAVAHSGTHELSVIDRAALHEKIRNVAAGTSTAGYAKSLEDIPNDLAFTVGLRRRLALPGRGPRGVLVRGDEAQVAEYFSDSLARVPLAEGAGAPAVRTIALGAPVEPDAVRRGEIAFHDASLCFQQWQSCASCHPDARADGLNWDLLNDGIGNPKNNRTMLYTHFTPPVMITGIRANAEMAVRAGFRFIQFAQVPEEVSASVDAYLKALKPVSSPRLVEGKLSAAARRGQELFKTAGCIDCHHGDYHTDGLPYDVGTGPDERGIREFITPPLTEVWRTAPYLFDGRAATMKDVLTTCNPKDEHGKTSTLTAEEVDDLVEYILSL